ncbi:pyrroloquinoline quinone precursor peptide PqqA [Thiorhodococcus drewsii]|uniref:pyrroloquinoline quinone precursor peptide PqqA n=1 Tax=Thiorhodococcus drewsii TaxID=210408 RepID=UPI000A01F0A0
MGRLDIPYPAIEARAAKRAARYRPPMKQKWHVSCCKSSAKRRDPRIHPRSRQGLRSGSRLATTRGTAMPPPLCRRRRTRPMTWSTPAYEDLRLGFEINLYINNR